MYNIDTTKIPQRKGNGNGKKTKLLGVKKNGGKFGGAKVNNNSPLAVIFTFSSVLVCLLILTGVNEYKLSAEETIVKSASELYNEYLLSEPTTDKPYQGERIEVRGIISDIQKEFDSDITSVGTVSFWTDNEGSVTCTDIDEISHLRKGAYITVRGECVGMGDHNIIIKNCVLQ